MASVAKAVSRKHHYGTELTKNSGNPEIRGPAAAPHHWRQGEHNYQNESRVRRAAWDPQRAVEMGDRIQRSWGKIDEQPAKVLHKLSK